MLWSSNITEENDQQPHEQILRAYSSEQRRSSSGKLATKIKRSVLSLVSSTNQNSVRTEGGLIMDDSCATSSEASFTGCGIDPFEVAIPINKRTSYSFPLATSITPSPTLHQGSNEKAELLAPSQCENSHCNGDKVKQLIAKMPTHEEQNNPNQDSLINLSNPTNFLFNPFDVTPDNTFVDSSNSQNNITPLKLWPNDNSGDFSFSIIDDTSSTTIIQPKQTPLQVEHLQKTKSSQLFEKVTASGFNEFAHIVATKHANNKNPMCDDIISKTTKHGNVTNALSKAHNPSTVDSSKQIDVHQSSSMVNGFGTEGFSTPTIPSGNTRCDTTDAVVITNDVPSNPDDLTKISDITARVSTEGEDDTAQKVLTTITNSTTSIENGYAVKGALKDKTVARPKTATNDQSTSTDPYFTNTVDGKSMKGEDKIFLLPTNIAASSPTKLVYIEVLNKNAHTLSPCSHLVEVEVNHRLDDSIDACSPIKIKEDVSDIDADASDRFHFIDVTPFTSTPTKNLNAWKRKPYPVDVTTGAAVLSVEKSLIGSSRGAVNADSSLFLSGCDTPTRKNNSKREGNGVLMQFDQEPMKNDKGVKFHENASVHLLYQEERIHGKFSTNTLDGIRSTLQYFFRLINCAEVTMSPNNNQDMTRASSLLSQYYMNEQSILDDVGCEVYINDTGDENKHKMQHKDSLTPTTKQLFLEETAHMSNARNERKDHTETTINSVRLSKNPSNSSFNGLHGKIRAENIIDGTSLDDTQGINSSLERISDLFDACYPPGALEMEGTRSHQIQKNSYNNTVKAAGGFHTPVRQETPEENAIMMNPAVPTKLSPHDEKKANPKYLTSLIDGCQYPLSFSSADDGMAVEVALWNNSHSNAMKGFHTPEPRGLCDIELSNNSRSTEKRCNVNKKWLGEITLGAVLKVCHSPLEYNKDDISDPSSVSFSPVNEPPLFVEIPTFQELSVIPEETSNSFSSILEDLEGVALMAATHDFNTPLRRPGSSSSRKKGTSNGKLSKRSHINSCLESNDSSNSSTISTKQSRIDSFSTTKLIPSQDDLSVAVDKSSTLNTDSSDDPQASKEEGVKPMHSLEKENFELESEPGHLPISRFRVGIRPLLQLHLDAACLSTKAPPKDHINSNHRSTSIRTQARIILEQRRYNIRRTKSDSNISNPIQFLSGNNRAAFKQATQGCCSKEVTPSSRSYDNKQKEDTYSATTLHSQKKRISVRPHNSNGKSPEGNKQSLLPMKRNSSLRPLLATSAQSEALQRSNKQGNSRLTSIKNSSKHDIVRTASASDWEFKTPKTFPSNSAALKESDLTNEKTTKDQNIVFTSNIKEKIAMFEKKNEPILSRLPDKII